MKIIQVNAQILKSIIGRFKTLIGYFKSLYKKENSPETLELLKLTEGLKNSAVHIALTEKHWRSLINASPDIIGSYDQNLTLTFISNSFTKETGISTEGIIGKTIPEMQFVFQKEEWIAALNEVFTKNITSDYYSEFRTPNGLKYYYTKFFPQTLGDIVQHVIFCTRDITTIKEQKKEILDKNRELQKVNEHLDNLIYTIAHDLKAPLTNLQSLIPLLNNATDMKDLKSYIGMTEKTVVRLSSTLNGLMDLIAMDNMQNEVVKKVSLSSIVEMVKEDYANDISLCNGCIELDIKECSEVVYVEAYLLSIVKNLISNAIKYRKSTIPLKILLKCKKEKEYVVIKISDNGTGMDLEKNGDKLFKPFSRLTNKVEGKGIGLHLIRNMIEKNGGKIEVTSEIGKGTTFTCYLKEYELNLELADKLKYKN